MLFTTSTFILFFLPVVLTGYYWLGRRSGSTAALWLLLASLAFYAHWMPLLTLLLMGSITLNFLLGGRIASHARAGAPSRR
ncbi:MAG: MBOAT family protein, partial [Inhella sp.]